MQIRSQTRQSHIPIIIINLIPRGFIGCRRLSRVGGTYNNLINCHIDHAYQCNNCTDWNIPTANMCPFWCITSIDTHPSLFVHLLCESMWWNIQFIIIHSNVVTVLSCLRTYLHVLVRVSNNTWESKNSIYLYKLNYWQESGNRSAHRATEKFRIRSEAKCIISEQLTLYPHLVLNATEE